MVPAWSWGCAHPPPPPLSLTPPSCPPSQCPLPSQPPSLPPLVSPKAPLPPPTQVRLWHRPVGALHCRAALQGGAACGAGLQDCPGVCVWGGTFLEAGRAAFKGVQRVVLAYKIAQVRGVLVVWGVLCVYGRGGRGLFPHRQKRCVVICAEGFWVSGRGWSVPPLECLLLCLPFKPSLPFPLLPCRMACGRASPSAHRRNIRRWRSSAGRQPRQPGRGGGGTVVGGEAGRGWEGVIRDRSNLHC